MCVRECVLSSLPRSLQHTLTHPLGLTYFFLNLKRKVTEKKKKINRTKHLYTEKAISKSKNKKEKKRKRNSRNKEHQKISIATATGVLLLASPNLCSLPVGRGR